MAIIVHQGFFRGFHVHSSINTKLFGTIKSYIKYS